MSDRYKEHKGSSRSARDDYRKHKQRDGRSRSRSRSPRRNRSPASSFTHSERPNKSRDKVEIEEKNHYAGDNWEESDEEVPAPPPPPRISKISIGFSKPKAPIKMTLGATSKAIEKPKPTVASVFNADDDEEPEEMPAEARMRMRNIGRETPTSAGPNSFGKTKQGFCDAKKVFEKNLKQALETADKPQIKFPQTIYKIKGP
ncbi:PEST proteolytic signal-containing nuclear protein-like [Melitaea cinxia]|uniref:PEST proteolytic signal-containing nuclear protein-like n=1 Tax=Melitaea cinxia TaxID=113334 RepID=UPI001E2741AA|nr:PEST proteolytic signal-containing nuclear protein-like [Melitaea cinxia]